MGAIAGLIGLITNLWFILFGLMLWSCGIAVARFSLRRRLLEDKAGQQAGKRLSNDRVARLFVAIGYLAIATAIVFGWFMFTGNTAYKAEWPVYGFIVSVIIYLLTVLLGSSYTAWKIFIRDSSNNK